MTTLQEARALALALPEASEQDHHGMTSFRIRGKIFATVPDDAHLRILADNRAIHWAVTEHPAACQEFYWGKRLACVVVDLARATPELVDELLACAVQNGTPVSLDSGGMSTSDITVVDGPSTGCRGNIDTVDLKLAKP